MQSPGARDGGHTSGLRIVRANARAASLKAILLAIRVAKSDNRVCRSRNGNRQIAGEERFGHAVGAQRLSESTVAFPCRSRMPRQSCALSGLSLPGPSKTAARPRPGNKAVESLASQEVAIRFAWRPRCRPQESCRPRPPGNRDNPRRSVRGHAGVASTPPTRPRAITAEAAFRGTEVRDLSNPQRFRHQSGNSPRAALFGHAQQQRDSSAGNRRAVKGNIPRIAEAAMRNEPPRPRSGEDPGPAQPIIHSPPRSKKPVSLNPSIRAHIAAPLEEARQVPRR